MNSDELALFAKVARHRSISNAAIELGVDQSTITRHIARLEQQVGVRLFFRNGRGTALTDSGAAFLRAAQKVLDAMDEAQGVAHALAHQGPARLVIAAPPTIGSVIFSRLAVGLLATYPATALHFVEDMGSHVLKLLTDGQADIGLVYAPAPAALAWDSLRLTEAIHLVGPSDAAPLGASFPARRLGELPLVLPTTSYGLRMQAEMLARNLGITLDVRVECDTGSATLTRMVADGAGYTLMPYAMVRDEIALGHLQAAPLADPPLHRGIVLAMARNRDTAAGSWSALQAVRRIVVECVREGAWPGVSVDTENEVAALVDQPAGTGIGI
ncbi:MULTISPECIES: LysR family transcriptional regulator [unclassified Achromobacter]|uniref:LysR family transcriptional regulator n=1 Tax=unclassified Achromobacter TaxID=2626865 RepID=UPI001302FEEF|nr:MULTISPECIES: LysR family transcriptional regulator [unclassified Achromobacter]